jgi:hypothetical protein
MIILITERSPPPPKKKISKAGTIQVYQRTAQQERIAEAPTTGLEARGRTQEALSGSERINEGQGGRKETSQSVQYNFRRLQAVSLSGRNHIWET